MKTYRKSLPPLDSLLFFYAAARNRSLTSAADKLFVTQAAVRKRIQWFED
jgi:LysR family glycine cleavage system transcriptional activator